MVSATEIEMATILLILLRCRKFTKGFSKMAMIVAYIIGNDNSLTNMHRKDKCKRADRYQRNFGIKRYSKSGIHG